MQSQELHKKRNADTEYSSDYHSQNTLPDLKRRENIPRIINTSNGLPKPLITLLNITKYCGEHRKQK